MKIRKWNHKPYLQAHSTISSNIQLSNSETCLGERQGPSWPDEYTPGGLPSYPLFYCARFSILIGILCLSQYRIPFPSFHTAWGTVPEPSIIAGARKKGKNEINETISQTTHILECEKNDLPLPTHVLRWKPPKKNKGRKKSRNSVEND